MPLPSTLKFACLCRQVTGDITFSSPSASRIGSLCHCSMCRHTSGVACTTTISSSTCPFTFDITGPLKSYAASPGTTLFFCKLCGSSVYEEDKEISNVAFHTGVLEDPDGTIEISNQCCVPETKDGGLSPWLDLPTSSLCLVHKNAAASTGETAPPPSKEQQFPAFCHCKGVNLKITPPSEASAKLSSPYSNLIVPSNSGSPANPKDEKWWLRANGTKYFAGTCACTSCRLACGNDIQTWTFVPKTNIRQLNGEPLDYSAGTLKQYESSEGRYRHFCRTCGATVFWRSDRRSEELIDVAVGLFDASSGVRAEEILEWSTERVSHREDAQNKGLIVMLGEGIKRAGTKSGCNF